MSEDTPITAGGLVPVEAEVEAAPAQAPSSTEPTDHLDHACDAMVNLRIPHELIAGFRHVELAAGRTRDTFRAYRARLDDFAAQRAR